MGNEAELINDELLNNKEYREQLAWSYLKDVLKNVESTDLHLLQFALETVL